MENNVNMQQPVVRAEAEQVSLAKSSNKFWFGFFIGIVTTIVLGVAFVFGSSYIFFKRAVEPSLMDARTKGNAAALKSNLSILRAEAEVYYDGNDQSYSGVCRSSRFITIISNINPQALDNEVVCYDGDASYAVAATYLDTDGVKTYCVNSSGAASDIRGRASQVVQSAGSACR